MSVVSSLVAFASQAAPRFSSRVLASSGYTLDADRLGGPDAFSVWTESTALRQDRAWQPIVDAAKAGHPREDVVALYGALEALQGAGDSILEVGCGGGYNSEIIRARFPVLRYYGIDISDAMISIAKEHYPDRSFAVASAYDLPLADESYDVVVDGVALIHMPGWKRALPEYARVAKQHVVLHGLTLTDVAPTTQFAKYAYGQPSLELVFNRGELLAEVERLGLRLIHEERGLDYDLRHYIGIESVSDTWVLEKGLR